MPDNQLNQSPQTTNLFLLPISDAFSEAWKRVSGTKASVWAAIAIIVLISIAFSILQYITKEHLVFLFIIISIIGELINFFLNIGMLYIGINRAFDNPISYRLIFKTLQSWGIMLNIIVLYILKIVIYIPAIIIFCLGAAALAFSKLLAVLLFIIATILLIYLSVRMILSIAFVLNKSLNPWDAIKSSFNATRNNFWRLVGAYFILLCILIISAIPLGIGLIWTIPLAFVLFGVIYKWLLRNTQYI